MLDSRARRGTRTRMDSRKWWRRRRRLPVLRYGASPRFGQPRTSPFAHTARPRASLWRSWERPAAAKRIEKCIYSISSIVSASGPMPPMGGGAAPPPAPPPAAGSSPERDQPAKRSCVVSCFCERSIVYLEQATRNQHRRGAVRTHGADAPLSCFVVQLLRPYSLPRQLRMERVPNIRLHPERRAGDDRALQERTARVRARGVTAAAVQPALLARVAAVNHPVRAPTPTPSVLSFSLLRKLAQSIL